MMFAPGMSEPPKTAMPSVPVETMVFLRIAMVMGLGMVVRMTLMERPWMPEMSSPSMSPVTSVNMTPSSPVATPGRMAKSRSCTLVRSVALCSVTMSMPFVVA